MTQMSLWKRAGLEHRTFIIPIAAGLLLNIAAYGLWVYPLGVKSAGAADRAAAAAQAVQAAERENAAARALVAGKSRAEQELSTFYDKVLPADMPAARQLTYTPLLAGPSDPGRETPRAPGGPRGAPPSR